MNHFQHHSTKSRILLMALAMTCFCGLLLPLESRAKNPEGHVRKPDGRARKPEGRAKNPEGSGLEKMPADLETALALSALPTHLQAAATVYLLDPAKGYTVARKGSNGFACLVSRTEWEWGKFRNDLFAPMGFDPEGVKAILPIYRDEAAMRASGRFTALQVKDTILSRIRKGIYRAPGKGGICYMLAPVMRVYTGNPGDEHVMTMNMPHYMFYAPYVTNSDVGTDPNSPNGPWMVNPDESVLGVRKTPYGYLIMPADEKVKGKILNDNKDLLKRLADYSPYFKTDAMAMQH